jgi:predicted MFS family arabinose efflux permease
MAGLIIGKWGYASIFLYGSAAAVCAFVLIFSRARFESSRSGGLSDIRIGLQRLTK